MREAAPPKLARKLLLSFLRDDLAEEVGGDLEEKFYVSLKARSSFHAKINYWFQVLNYVRPFAIRKSTLIHVNQYDMVRNYFRVSLRSTLRQKLYSLINIGGLALGLTCFMLIALYVQHELSYDRFFKNVQHIHRIYQRQAGNVSLGTDYYANTPVRLASVLLEEFPEVAYATAIQDHYALLSHRGNHYWELGLWADQHFFKVFTYPLTRGDPTNILENSNSIVLTESLAIKIFGQEDPLGQALIYQDGEPLVVTGIMADPPTNASIKFSFIVSLQSNREFTEQLARSTWTGNSLHTFVTLTEGADPRDLEKKFPGLLKKYRDPEGYSGYPFKEEYIVQPLSKIHLQSNVNGDIGQKGNPTHVYLFSIIAIIVLFLACVNYMNLAIARSTMRAQEVGLRKVVGALRTQLIGQFLGESVLISFLALLSALGFTYLLLPVFGDLVERPIQLNLFENKVLMPGLLVLVVMVGLLSGSYPALVMSSLRPVYALKGKMHGIVSGFKLQRWLVVMQYTVSIVLIVSSLVIYLQLRFLQHKDPGYDREHVVVINSRNLMKNYEVIKNQWLHHPNIAAVTASSDLPISITSSTIINDDDGTSKEDDLAIYRILADSDFLDVFGIELVAGRNFSPAIVSDHEERYLINETAARALGWTPAEALGKQYTYEGVATIIGVVKDFHLHSMHLPIQPLMIGLRADNYSRFISVKVQPEKLPETIALLEETVKSYSPYPFEYQFLDDRFDQLYKAEMKLGGIFGFFTTVSILIASLGLFGLAAFMAGQRTKEIGIRKVLGASTQSILTLLTRDFMTLIVVAFIVSIPIAWYIMHVWLQNFTYRIEMEWWMFLSAGALTLFVGSLTIGYQSLKASLMDPVNSLRSE